MIGSRSQESVAGGEDVLVLDAECGLCTRSALFLKPRLTAAGSLRFVGQQSEEGRSLMERLPPALRSLDTVVLFRGEQVHVRSAAVLRCGLYLRWWYRWLVPLGLLIPRPIRDAVYGVIARNRTRWWPPSDSCAL